MPANKIIDHYLIREVLYPFAVILTALLVIFVTFSLSRLLLEADAGLLKPAEVASLTLFKAIISLDVLVPLSLFLAVMTGLGRLYTDSEIYAMRASGISEARLLRPLMRLALVLAIIVGLFSTWARPWAYTQAYQLKANAEASAETGRVKSARFYDFEDGGRTVFVEKIADNGSDLDGVFIRTRKDGDVQVITATKGIFDYLSRPLHHRLILIDARVMSRTADGADISAQFGKLTLWLKANTPEPPGYKVKSASTARLRESTASGDRAEFQWRLSTPVSALLLTLAAIPLSRSRPRQGRYAKILLALAIYAVYFNLLDVSRSWVEQGNSSYIWWVPGLLTLVVVALYIPAAIKMRRDKRAQN